MAIKTAPIRIKRSAVTASPTTLLEGELAYSESSGNLFIGTAGGTNISVIGGLTAITKLAGIQAGATTDQTPAQILAALITVDGAGSLLDADTVDGIQAADLAKVTDLVNYIQVTQKGVPNGVASLDGSGLVPTSQIPALAITTPNVVTTQAAMLALTAQAGDVAIRTDLGKSFMLSAADATLLSNWIEISVGGAITSVNGQVGVVVLAAADVGADPTGSAAAVQSLLATHTADMADPHGTIALLSAYIQNGDEIDGGSF